MQPPLTRAGCILQAAPLPKGGQGLVFSPGGGRWGQVGGHGLQLGSDGKRRNERVRSVENRAFER